MKCFAKNSSIADFLRPSSKNKKSSYNFLYLKKKSHFLALILRNFLYFLKRKLFLYFGKWKPLKTFQETKLFNFFESSYISGGNFPSSKNEKKSFLKKLLIFVEIEISSPKLKKLQEVTCKD